MNTLLIPGGTGGLGQPVTQRLVADGYRCIVPYWIVEEAQRLRSRFAPQQHDQLVLLEADMLDAPSVDRVFEVCDSLGALHGLVHLLGGVRTFQNVSDTAVEDWDTLMDLNLRSLFLASRLAMRRFEIAGRGRIVSIAAMAAVKPSATQAAYGVTKAGVVALTRVLADEGRAFGVTANCIAPGILRTPANLAWGSEEEARKWTTPEEIADLVSYLLSDAARGVNGTVLQAFGGLNV